MRITFILTSYSRKPIGGFRVVYEYANRLVKNGHQVNIVYPKQLKNLPDRLSLYRKVRKEVGYLSRVFLKLTPQWQFMDSRIRSFYIPEPTAFYIPDADVVFATFWTIAEYMEKYPKTKGEKTYFFQHYMTWGSPKEKVDATWKSSFHKVVVSKWLYDIGLALGAKDMVYIPNGIDHNHFKILTPIEKRTPCISMMYSEVPWKGSKEGIEALILAKKKFPKIRAILFGVNKPNSNIPNWIEYQKNPSQNSLVENIYNQSSIFLCSSHIEGFGLPPAEAMACGCAVVTNDCGGVKDFAKNEVTALISSSKNSLSLAQNIIKLLEDDGLRIKIAKNGQKYIQQFNWKKSTDLLENFLKKIVNQNK